MRGTWSRGMALLVLVPAVGCADGTPGVTQGAISGGTSDTVDVAVVGIQDDTTGAQCTGALIAPNLILTAQHCVAPIIGVPDCAGGGDFGPPGAPSSFYVTTRPMFTFNPGDYHQAAQIRIPPGTGICGRDLALLVLTDVIAPSEAEDIAPRVDPALQPGEVYSAVGYGATDDMGTGSGERRRRDGLTIDCVGTACVGGVAGEWLGEAGVCQGDSGGPALDDQGRVIGVASRGAVGCIFPIYGDVSANAAWLISEAQQAAAAGGYQAPAWASGGTPDAGLPGTPDAGSADATPPDGDGDGGCGCHTSRGATPGWPAALLLAVAALTATRRAAGRWGRTRPVCSVRSTRRGSSSHPAA